MLIFSFKISLKTVNLNEEHLPPITSYQTYPPTLTLGDKLLRCVSSLDDTISYHEKRDIEKEKKGEKIDFNYSQAEW